MPSLVASARERELEGRPLWGTERFWNFAHSEHQGAFDMVSMFEIDGSVAAKHMRDWARAWIEVSKSCPTLFQCISNEQGEARVAFHEEDVADRVFPGPVFKGAQQRIDHCLQNRSFDSVALTVFQQEECEASVHVAITNPHALGDAKGVLGIANLLIGALGELKDEVSERVARDPPTPTKASLQPCANADGHESRLGIREMFEVAKKGVRISAFSNCRCRVLTSFRFQLALPTSVNDRISNHSKRAC